MSGVLVNALSAQPRLDDVCFLLARLGVVLGIKALLIKNAHLDDGHLFYWLPGEDLNLEPSG